MQIKLIAVEVNTVPGKKYKQIDVTYKNDKGETKGKKVMDFAIKSGVQLLTNGKAGDMLDVTVVKEGEYWNWTAVAPAGEAPAASSSSAPAKSGNSFQARDFETKEERAARQVMIVRQSSISSAVSLLKTEKTIPSVDEILKVAAAFEEFVMRTNLPVTKLPPIEEMEDDIPY